MRYIAYYRVSTQKQGKSGLGLEAQKAMVSSFAKKKDKIVAEYTEVESGRKVTRVELAKAIERAEREDATLLIAKLDRLARNVGFIFALRDSGARFICCDIPEANTLTIGIFAVMAQHESEINSQRTRDALKALKKRGVKLGTPANLNDAARRKGREAHAKLAREHIPMRQAAELASLYRKNGLTYAAIAGKLNESGYITHHGNKFYGMTVLRMTKMFA